MYEPKNYLLSMLSHWPIRHSTYNAVQESLPLIMRYSAAEGVDRMEKTPLRRMMKNPFPDVYTVPIFRRRWCEMMIKEIGHMQDHLGFEVNPDEDKLRQIPEIVLRDACPTLYRNMWFVVRSVLNPIIMSLWQRACPDPASIQIANYNLAGTGMGHWHHDESADVSIVVPLNSQSYEGGGTEFHNFGKRKPLPTGHGLVFPSFTHSHRGLPVISGDRYLLVFWLTDKARSINLATNTP